MQHFFDKCGLHAYSKPVLDQGIFQGTYEVTLPHKEIEFSNTSALHPPNDMNKNV